MADGDKAAEPFLTPAEIADWPVAGATPEDRFAPLRTSLMRHRVWDDRQLAGRNLSIGCIALEITQRCNLDCTLCYLSEHAEAVRDVPLDELFRRIDAIRAHYGPNTDVQVTGGDPTLRRRDELVAIVRRIREREMRPALFTNGIRATRDLLRELAAAGLIDVAFHVDMTQERSGHTSEVSLNGVRLDYIERARGLGLRTLFNTTVFDGNFTEIPLLARFFADHADAVHLASFQLQADTGRGVLRQRDAVISQQSVIDRISEGIGFPVDFDAAMVGHPRCNRYAGLLESGGRLYPLFDDPAFFAELFGAAAGRRFDWHDRRQWLPAALRMALGHPGLCLRAIGHVARKAWRMRAGLLRSRGRVNRLSVFVHNFMDAERLERDRCESCVFMVATADGPVSMCVHNAKRDAMILRPLVRENHYWDPLTGAWTDTPPATEPVDLPLKRRKGRSRQARRIRE